MQKIILQYLVWFKNYTHNTQPFYGSVEFVRDNPVSQYHKKHSPTHTYHGHQSHQPVSPYTTIHGILPIQSTCFTVFVHNLSPSFLWSTSWLGTLHFISSPNHYLLFATHAHTITTCSAVVLRLCPLIPVSLSTFYSELYLVTSHHTSFLPFSSLLLKCHLIFLSYRPGLTSMQHTTSHTTAVQSPSHCQ